MPTQVSLLCVLCVAISAAVNGLHYDYVIAGGGTSGLLLAIALTANPNITVVVLEAGVDGRKEPLINVPSNEGRIQGTSYDWQFRTVPQPNLENHKMVDVNRGKVLGGSSAMNFMIWHRASSVEFDAYESVLGNSGWNWRSLFTAFKGSEHFHNPMTSAPKQLTYNDAYHGMKGDIQGTMAREVYSLYSDYLSPTLKGLGVKIWRDLDGGNTTGAAYVPIAVDPKTYTRSYSGSAYTDAEDRDNLHVLTNSRVSRILWPSVESGVATASGVEYYNTSGKPATKSHLNASKVIISAGSIQAPQLLELSGIGDPSIMNPLGIRTIIDLPSVGVGLQDHLTYAGSFSFNKSDFLGADQPQTYLHMVPASEFLSDADHAMASSLLSSENAPHGVSQTTWLFFKYLFRADEPLVEFGWYDAFVNAYLLHPLSEGTVHINSSNPLMAPRIDPEYNSASVNGTSLDLWFLSRGVQYLAAKLSQTSPLNAIAANYSVDNNLPNAQFESKIYQGLGSGQHFTGGARMLPKSHGGVVDERLRVYGTSNVHVVDCSVIPVQPGQHPMGLAYAIAIRAATLLEHDP